MGERTEVLSGVLVTPDFFDVLGSKPIIGSRITPENAYLEGAKSALISFRLWTRFFDEDPGVVGKTVFFAFFIGVIACFKGLNARGGADGVGRATTNTVVVSSISVIISDFFLTKLFLLF